MPGERFIDVVSDEEEDIQSHGCSGDNSSVGGEIFEISHQHQFKEHNRVDTLLTFGAIVMRSGFIEKPQVDGFFESSVEVVVRDTVRQLEIGEEFFFQ